MIEDLKQDAATRMQKCVEAFQADLRKLRTGRAHPSLVENMKVDYYGSDVPLKQVANGQASKVFIPYEATAILGALGGIQEVLKEGNGGKRHDRPQTNMAAMMGSAPSGLADAPPPLPGK